MESLLNDLAKTAANETAMKQLYDESVAKTRPRRKSARGTFS